MRMTMNPSSGCCHLEMPSICEWDSGLCKRLIKEGAKARNQVKHFFFCLFPPKNGYDPLSIVQNMLYLGLLEICIKVFFKVCDILYGTSHIIIGLWEKVEMIIYQFLDLFVDPPTIFWALQHTYLFNKMMV